jgi:soluble lytic murein transglycosylase
MARSLFGRLRRSLRGPLVIAFASSCGGEVAVKVPPSGPAIVAHDRARDVTAKELSGEVPVLSVVLDDPRFAAVRPLRKARDFAGAAKAFDDVLATLGPDDDAVRACARTYTVGALHRDAGDDAGAAPAFDAVPESCPLHAHASFYAAGAYARAGRADDAIARAQRVPDDAPLAADARLLVAEALAAKGDRAAALPIWRAHLAASPHGVRWVDTAVKVALALLDGVDGDAAAHAREAFDLATRVVVEAPKLADASGGQAARDRAAVLLHASDPKLDLALTPADHARRAQAWLEANEPAKAITEATPLLGLGAASPSASPDTCRAAVARAQAYVKTRAPAADAFGDAIARCSGDDALPSALFNGAKASFSAKRPDEGLARYAELERLFPRHRLADDARLRAAVYLQQSGDPSKAETMLAALEGDYPDGDMRDEALFRVALARMARGDWAGAKEPLDRAEVLEAADLKSVGAGRAAYFRARVAAATGDADDAGARYAKVVAERPLSFYMAEAYARLSAIDPERAKHALEEALARETAAAPSRLLTRDHAALRSAAFARGRALLEVGEIDDARRELARALDMSDAPPTSPLALEDKETLWAVALLYEEAGAPDAAQWIVRERLGEHLAHYPVGRWKTCWEIAYPRPFGDLVERASAASGIPTSLTWAIMRQESAFVADARSPSDAYGLMQIIVPTARGLSRGTGFDAAPESLKRPEVSITLGAKLLGSLRASYPSNRALAIAAYNGGGGAVGRWLAARPNEDFDLWVEEIPYDETRGYVKRVLANEAAYAFLYAPAALDEVLALPPRVAK